MGSKKLFSCKAAFNGQASIPEREAISYLTTVSSRYFYKTVNKQSLSASTGNFHDDSYLFGLLLKSFQTFISKIFSAYERRVRYSSDTFVTRFCLPFL